MTAEIIDCERIARELRSGVEAELASLRAADIAVGLATVVVGDDPAALGDQRRLGRFAGELGVSCDPVRIPGSAAGADVAETIRGLGEDPVVTGIVVLGPLPSHLDEAMLLGTIRKSKDVDGAHPEHVGLMTLGDARNASSTGRAIFEVLDWWVADAGHDAGEFYRRSRIVVVGGASKVATEALLLGRARRAPVALVDPLARTGDQLGWYTRHADVLVVAANLPGLIRAEHVRRGVIVLDAGSTHLAGGDTGEVRVVGDVAFDEVVGQAGALTMVPNGIGAVREMVLLRSVARAAHAAHAETGVLEGAR